MESPTGGGLSDDRGNPEPGANGMQLPQGWRVWLLVLLLNAAGAYLWYLDRNVEAPMSHSGIGDWLRSLGL